jgi:putative sterol carrier protein
MTEEFFHQLATSPPPTLKKMSATIRFDVEDGPTTKHWLLMIDHGTVQVSHRKAKADAAARISRNLFERILAGEANTMAAALRGEISMEGDPELMVAFQRLMPGPTRRAS